MKSRCVLVFVAAFLIGMVLVYVSPIEYKTVFVYPTPDNVKDIQFRDDADTCYHFDSVAVSCESAKNINAIPVQS
jgi:hypothetical protein